MGRNEARIAVAKASFHLRRFVTRGQLTDKRLCAVRYVARKAKISDLQTTRRAVGLLAGFLTWLSSMVLNLDAVRGCANNKQRLPVIGSAVGCDGTNAQNG
jgi:hypothetical protein